MSLCLRQKVVLTPTSLCRSGSRARYVAPDFKAPPTGEVTLEPEDFVSLDAFDADTDCKGATVGETEP